MAEDAINVVNNEVAERFEVQLDGSIALLQYRRLGERIVYIHTEVPDALAGRGIGGALARTSLEFARAQHLTVVPLCPFVRAYIQQHPEYQTLVASTGQRTR